jgi:hypothetical protein
MRANEIIAGTLGMDIGEMNECRYQPTRNQIPIYTVGDDYFCCPQAGKAPPKGWKWKPHGDQFWAARVNRIVYVAQEQP